MFSILYCLFSILLLYFSISAFVLLNWISLYFWVLYSSVCFSAEMRSFSVCFSGYSDCIASILGWKTDSSNSLLLAAVGSGPWSTWCGFLQMTFLTERAANCRIPTPNWHGLSPVQSPFLRWLLEVPEKRTLLQALPAVQARPHRPWVHISLPGP